MLLVNPLILRNFKLIDSELVTILTSMKKRYFIFGFMLLKQTSLQLFKKNLKDNENRQKVFIKGLVQAGYKEFDALIVVEELMKVEL